MKNFKMDSEGPRHIHHCPDCNPTLTPNPIDPRYGLTDSQRDMVYRAAGYANAMVKVPKSKAAAWIEHFTDRLQRLALESEEGHTEPEETCELCKEAH